MSNPNTKPAAPTPEQYSAQLKQTVYSLAGELTSQMGSCIDQLMQQLNNSNGRAAHFAQENQRLTELLKTNNISTAIVKESKIAPPPVITPKRNVNGKK